MNQRMHRVQELILREIGVIIQTEMHDPRAKLVTVTAVRVSSDMSFAKVYFTVMAPPDEIKAISKALDHAKGFLRSKIAERIEIKHIPELKFYYDDTLANADRLEQIFKQIKGE